MGCCCSSTDRHRHSDAPLGDALPLQTIDPQPSAAAPVIGVDGAMPATGRSSARPSPVSPTPAASGANRGGGGGGAAAAGTGPLRPHVWTSDRAWTREELLQAREEFFDTRVSGRPEAWHAIRTAVNFMGHDLRTAQSVLDEADVLLPPSGDLVDGAYDGIGNYYPLPNYCVSDPINLYQQPGPSTGTAAAGQAGQDRDGGESSYEPKGKGRLMATVDEADVNSPEILVRVRLSDRDGPDVIVTTGRHQPLRSLIKLLRIETGIPASTRIKIVYLGRVLEEWDSLPGQGWVYGHVVSALVSK
ncbi:MAG: Ubiquitin domain-containing protein 2 [Phylliscum demangeonii]|nr:MAG: Ubiquitin domain-containing protein 2 [Phylliscum demangeonii]